jgi:hypothetical protein
MSPLKQTDREFTDPTRRGRFAYQADLEEFARDLEEAKWPTNREGRVTSESDLASNEAEHTADALYYGISYYCHRSQICLPPNSPPRYRPLTAGLLNMQF